MTRQDELKLETIYKMVKGYYFANHNFAEKGYKDKTRKGDFVEMRQLAHHFAKTLTKASLAEIGAYIGGKDHATVIHSCKAVNNRLNTEREYKIRYEHLEELITNALIFDESVYVSGPITNPLKEHGWEHVEQMFNNAEQNFKNCIVVNPMKLFTEEEVATFTQLQFLQRCIQKLSKCSVIYMMKGYEDSFGAMIELEIAKNFKLKIIYEE
jgi:hypothetical protein